jgi:hypothetical protein
MKAGASWNGAAAAAGTDGALSTMGSTRTSLVVEVTTAGAIGARGFKLMLLDNILLSLPGVDELEGSIASLREIGARASELLLDHSLRIPLLLVGGLVIFARPGILAFCSTIFLLKSSLSDDCR